MNPAKRGKQTRERLAEERTNERKRVIRLLTSHRDMLRVVQSTGSKEEYAAKIINELLWQIDRGIH
jgi:hypothetical protein